MKEEAKRKVEEWKTLVDELNVQFHLGTEEAKEEFEEQKKKLGKWLDAVSHKLQHAKELSKEKALQLKSSMEELRVQAALGTAETKEQLEEQQKKITRGIHQFKHKISEAFETSKEGIDDIVENVDHELNDFHTRFDLFRLHFHLGKEETKEMRDDKKKEIANQLHVIKTKLKKGNEAIGNIWDHFSSDIKEEWNRIRNIG